MAVMSIHQITLQANTSKKESAIITTALPAIRPVRRMKLRAAVTINLILLAK
jgi:hypothetical protein